MLISRRTVFASGFAGFAGLGLSTASGPALGQSAGVARGVARGVGLELAKGALGKVGGEAFGKVLDFAGLGDGGADAIHDKLNKILESLADLQRTLDGFRSETARALAQLSYDVNVAPVRKLIATNHNLMKRYRTLLTSGSGDVDAQMHDIDKLYDGEYLSGIETWHSSLTGDSGQTGLIRAWGQAVLSQTLPYYGTTRRAQGGPRMVQSQWDYFDAQQALTANFLVVYLRGTEQVQSANDVHRLWRANRTQQVRSLRGGTLKVDRFPARYEDRRLVTIESNLNALPDDVVMHQTKSGGWQMWFTRAGRPVAQSGGPIDFSEVEQAAIAATGIDAGWRLPDYGEFQSLVNQVPGGNQLGESEYFTGSLKILGFTELSETPLLWFRPAKGPFGWVYVMHREGRRWFHGAHDGNPNTRGHTLVMRDVPPGEARRYLPV